MKELKSTMAVMIAVVFFQAFAGSYPYDNLASGGTPSASGATMNAAASKPHANVSDLFDNDVNSYVTYGTLAKDAVLNIDYEWSEPKTVNAYAIQCAPSQLYAATSRAPQIFELLGYDEYNDSWVSLDRRTAETGWGNEEVRTYKIANAVGYKKYRLAVTAPANNAYIGFSELQLYFVDTRNVLVVESDAGAFGVPTPAYGEHPGMTVGSDVTCTLSGADASYEGTDGNVYKFFGYELWGNADTMSPFLLAEGDQSRVTYRQESYTKLVWKWTSPTRNLAKGGVVSAEGGTYRTSYPGSATVSVLSDDDAATYYGFQGVKNDGSFRIVNTLPSPMIANAYAIQCGPAGYYNAAVRAPSTFSLEGYDEHESVWEILDTRSSETWEPGLTHLYKFSNMKRYPAYRLVVTAPTGDVGFAELKLFYIDTRDTLVVASDVEEFGTPDPAYGETTGVAIGGEVTCSIADTDRVYTGKTGGRYTFAGYEVWAKADTGTPELIASGTETSVTYTQAYNTRLIWKWSAAPIRVAVDGNNANDGYSAPKATIEAAVSAATAGQTVEVGDGEYAISSPVSIEKDVVVCAANPGKVTVRGGGTHVLLTLNHAAARVAGIVFANGYAQGERELNMGSGVEITAGTLADSTVTGCTGEKYGCPAVWLKGADAILTGCTVSNNVSSCTDSNRRYYITHGAGVGLTAGLVENCLIAENRGGSSAGVWQSGGTVTGCTIVRNVGSHEQTGESATVGGSESCSWGTVFVKGGVFKDSTIAHNTASSAAGAYVLGTGRVQDCTVAFNRATMDRPLVIAPADMGVSENQATWIGGRIPVGGIVLGASAARVENCTIVSNVADCCGSDQGLCVIAGTATGNTLDENGEDLNSSVSTAYEAYVVPDDGETGVWPYDTPAKAARSLQAAVDAVAASRTHQGTVHVAAGDYFSPEDGWMLVLKRPVRVVGPEDGVATFRPSATGRGYGVWVADRDATLSRVTVTGFTTYSDDSGAIYGTSFSTAAGVVCCGTVETVTVTDCRHEPYTGASTLLVLGGRVTKCVISKNLKTGSGGIRQLGAGIRQYGGVVEDSLIEDNAASQGGGIAVCDDHAVVRRCRIVGNQASGYANRPTDLCPGAGVHMSGGSVESCLIVGNRATSTTLPAPHGAGVYLTGGRLLNCTVSDNTNTQAGSTAGVHQEGGLVKNTIVWRNSAAGEASDLVTVGGTAESNWTDDPKFRGTGSTPYRLAGSSPCLGRGDATVWTADDMDLLGYPRIVKGAVDLGCYQQRETGLIMIFR